MCVGGGGGEREREKVHGRGGISGRKRDRNRQIERSRKMANGAEYIKTKRHTKRTQRSI